MIELSGGERKGIFFCVGKEEIFFLCVTQSQAPFSFLNDSIRTAFDAEEGAEKLRGRKGPMGG